MSPGVEFDIKKPIKRKLLSMYFVRGWWTDKHNRPIKEAGIGDTIRFHIETEHVDGGDEIIFAVYDSDGAEFLDDKLSLTIQGTTNDYNKVKIIGNKGFIEWTTGEGSRALLLENFEGDELELYVKCEYKGNIVSLPHDSDNYLLLYEKEVLITVLIELPHSKETGWGAKGLAGHSAMAIGEQYFDYGPDYDLNNNGTPNQNSSGEIVPMNERDYDVDFNNDGDKDDIVNIDENTLDFKNAPGRPWWGEMVAKRLNKIPEDVKLSEVLSFINLDWYNDGTNIYGKVHKIEFYVKDNEAKKMMRWWQERYKHLKIYSVFPWAGEQCTTAVKSAIQDAFSFKTRGENWIPDTTQTPKGLLEDLHAFVSTSKQHSGQLAKITVIKQEDIDWPNP
ncbi:hypothetical protein C1637_13760 [Chryseobacterium lactis]|uniref:Uncharacterized protein n=1 Tax=Chryseobacterium lactis TaxID=1241981 RepID=A0A3G6RQ91_CHRLC|nr:hypothetical protein [Chryseobacterium lactis]AZA83809.1 hypothetical protein EG342_18805 [Chryseobacterium lactis]AZB04194.1 hypothetical protein EG341_09680 [Chryseobacterium lactis]PNW12897.1 hypothetical protein C1637_13760 [Chryseobacterium lactis]